jgi:hypothetical protein
MGTVAAGGTRIDGLESPPVGGGNEVAGGGGGEGGPVDLDDEGGPGDGALRGAVQGWLDGAVDYGLALVFWPASESMCGSDILSKH